MMRNNVTFQRPVEFVPVSESDGILSIEGAGWFTSLLKRIDGLAVIGELCQEDWGVVYFVERAGKRFWVGLSFWPEGESMWLAHFHHHSFAWLQRWTASGKHELERLICDFHSVLTSEPVVGDAAWHHERDMNKADPQGASTPTAS